MESRNVATGDGATQSLVEKLRAVRRGVEGRSDEDRREALRQALQDELGNLTAEETGRRLEQVREHLVREARQREGRVESLEADQRRLGAEVATLRAERNELAKENARLEASLAAPARGGGGGGEALEKIRGGLRAIADNPEATPAESGLAPSEDRFFRLVSELLKFALKLETAQNELLMTLQIGHGMDTQMIRRHQELIRLRFRTCLEDKPGSIQSLKEALNKTSRFLIDVNESYMASIGKGSKSLLTELDPQPILDKARGKLMMNYEDAFRSFSTIHSDLESLTPTEMWERYFQPPFRTALSERAATP